MKFAKRDIPWWAVGSAIVIIVDLSYYVSDNSLVFFLDLPFIGLRSVVFGLVQRCTGFELFHMINVITSDCRVTPLTGSLDTLALPITYCLIFIEDVALCFLLFLIWRGAWYVWNLIGKRPR